MILINQHLQEIFAHLPNPDHLPNRTYLLDDMFLICCKNTDTLAKVDDEGFEHVETSLLCWEDKYGEDEFQDRFALDYIRAANLGTQVGAEAVALDVIQRQTTE